MAEAFNLGFSGDRVEHLRWRLENGLLDGYRARCFTLMVGTNNYLDAPDVVAAGKRVHWLDFNAQFLDAAGEVKLLFPDRLHPNLDGFGVWYSNLVPRLRKLNSNML